MIIKSSLIIERLILILLSSLDKIIRIFFLFFFVIFIFRESKAVNLIFNRDNKVHYFKNSAVTK